MERREKAIRLPSAINSNRLEGSPTHGLMDSQLARLADECIEDDRTNRYHATAALTECTLRNSCLCDYRSLRPVCIFVYRDIHRFFLGGMYEERTFCRSFSLVFQY